MLTLVIPWRLFIWILCGILILLALSSFIIGNMVIRFDIESGLFYKLFQLVNLDFERNLPTWFSATLLTINGLCLLLIAYYAHVLELRHFAHWLILSLIFFMLSTDEFVQFHEQVIRPVRTLLNTDGFLYNAWIIPAAILVVPIGLAYIPFMLNLPKNIQKIYFLAGFIYLGAVLGIEAIGGHYYASVLDPQDTRYDTTYLLIINVEELLEMGSLILFLCGNFSYLGYLASLLKRQNTD